MKKISSEISAYIGGKPFLNFTSGDQYHGWLTLFWPQIYRSEMRIWMFSNVRLGFRFGKISIFAHVNDRLEITSRTMIVRVVGLLIWNDIWMTLVLSGDRLFLWIWFHILVLLKDHWAPKYRGLRQQPVTTTSIDSFDRYSNSFLDLEQTR